VFVDFPGHVTPAFRPHAREKAPPTISVGVGGADAMDSQMASPGCEGKCKQAAAGTLSS
jgi:hypothetical protein